MQDVKYDKTLDSIKRIGFNTKDRTSPIKQLKYNNKIHARDVVREDPRLVDSDITISDIAIEYQAIELLSPNYEKMRFSKDLIFNDLEPLTEKIIKPFVAYEGTDKTEAFKLLSAFSDQDLTHEFRHSIIFKRLREFLLLKVNSMFRNYFKSNSEYILSCFDKKTVETLYHICTDKEKPELNQWFQQMVYSLRKLFNVDSNKNFVDYYKDQSRFFVLEPTYISISFVQYYNLVLSNRIVEVDENSEDPALYKTLDNIFKLHNQYEFNYWYYNKTTKTFYKFKVYRTKDKSYIISYQGTDY